MNAAHNLKRFYTKSVQQLWCPSSGLAEAGQQTESHSSYRNEWQELQISLCLHPGDDPDSGMASQHDVTSQSTPKKSQMEYI